jgi:ribosomal protein S18 acetylase RimI-like enzyme
MTMGQFANYLFGAGDPQQAVRVMCKLFTQPQNRFSHQFADIVETDDTAIGLMLSYAGRIMNHLNLSMGMQLWGIYGALGFVRFVRKVLPLAFVREANADEYFINTLAVSHDFQGQGIGTHLLSYAEHKARKMHYNQCALSVEMSNLRARYLYERIGYRVVETSKFAWPKCVSGYTGYHRMVKAL